MIVLLPCYSLEDFSIYRKPEESNQIFSAFSALYHPALIEALEKMPGWDRAGNPLSGRKHRLILIPPCCEAQIPHKWLKESEEAGSIMIRKLSNREEIAAAALEKLGITDHGFSDEAVETFYSLGFCHFSSELLSRKLRYMSNLDTQNFSRQTQEAVKQLRAGEEKGYLTAIRRAFELLAESKAYFFPTAAKLLDLTWVDSATLGEPLREMLLRRQNRNEPTNLVLPTYSLDEMEENFPETFELVRTEIASGRVTLIGGDWDESPLYMLPPVEILRRLLDGRRFYAEKLGTIPAVFGRSRAGYSRSLAPLLRLAGFESALLMTQDGWRPNRENQSRINWEMETGQKPFPLLARAPLDGESDKSFMELADRVGYGANSDYVQTIVFEHRPNAERPWLGDMARMNRYAKVLGETVSMTSYFNASKGTAFRKGYEFDDFKTNYLTRAGRENRPDPVSLWSRYFRWREIMAPLGTGVLWGALSGSERSFESLAGFAELEADAEKIENRFADAESVLFPPMEPEDEEMPPEVNKARAQKREAVKKTAAQIPQSDDFSSAFDRLGKMLCGTLNQQETRNQKGAVSEEAEADGWFYANLLPIESPVYLTEKIADTEQNALLPIRRTGGETVLTLPPYSAAWVGTAGETAEPEQAPMPEPAKGKGGFFRKWKALRRSEPESAAMITRRKETFSDGRTDRFYALRNHWFELHVDETTGQVRSLRTFSAPTVRTGGGILRQPAMGNRLAWQAALRLNESQRRADTRPEESGGYGYTIMAADSVEIAEAGPPAAKLRISGSLRLPDGGKAASFVETIAISERKPVIEVEITFQPVILPNDKPWENYYGIRWAWNDTSAALFAGVGGRLESTSRDYLQAPECVDIVSDASIRLTILSGGLPFYRRQGLRRMDMVLIPKNESGRSFRFGIGVDLEDPLSEALRFTAPKPIALPARIPAGQSLLRFLDVEPRSVRPILLEPVYQPCAPPDAPSNDPSAENSSAEESSIEDLSAAVPEDNGVLDGFRLLLQETSGQKQTGTITVLFPLDEVRRVDFSGQKPEAVSLSTPNQFSVELRGGEIVPLELILRR